jgi:diguanylate cyclase
MPQPKQAQSDLQEWSNCLALTPAPTRRWVADVAGRAAQDVAGRFYQALLADPRAAGTLDHHAVNTRLHASLARWVQTLFDTDVEAQRQIDIQRQTGEVHARIGISMDLLTRGAREVKRALAEWLAGEAVPPLQLTQGVQHVYELIDLAIGLMGATSAADADRQARADEAYRLFFLTQDLSAERDRQRSRLLEWAQQILIRNYWEAGSAGATPPAPAASEFTLWLEHKASILFEDAPEVARIRQHIVTIEQALLPRLSAARGNPDAAWPIVAGINEGIAEVKALLSSMFDRYTAAEDGRDTVTPRLLSRRYFPTVAKREIAHAQRGGHGFALVLCDLDGFEHARETLGVAAADLLLGVVADVLTEHVRAGDFVFRVGDDQFLMLLVEMTPDSVMATAQGLRQRIERTQPRAAAHAAVPLRASFGVAMFDGHPDYQRLLDRAADALRSAQREGGNRCVLAA